MSRRKVARLRRIIDPRATAVPTVHPYFVGLSGVAKNIGVTPYALHPVVRHVIAECCVIASDAEGWSFEEAMDLAAEQADELRDFGLAHQIEVLAGALENDFDTLARVLADCSVGRQDVAIGRVSVTATASTE